MAGSNGQTGILAKEEAEVNLMLMQEAVYRINKKYGYTNDTVTLALGLCEEAGEVAKAVNLGNPKYIPSKLHVNGEGDIAHELCDTLVYILSIANAESIDLDYLMAKKLEKQLHGT